MPPEQCDGTTANHAPIYVTRTVVPELSAYTAYLQEIFSSRQLTNQGRFARELEQKLCAYLQTQYLSLCANGTTALQLAVRAAGLAGKKVITTPFSYVATLGSLLWEGCVPVFVDIEGENLCIDPALLEQLPEDPDCAGILPVHVYGNVCDVEAIEAFAKRRKLMVIYDAAHCFGSRYQGRSALTFGDYSICSFHATKIFHTAEGGCIVSRSEEAHQKIHLLRAFGHIGDTHYSVGTNAKMSELHAAMGLCLLDLLEENKALRKKTTELYDSLLPASGLRRPRIRSGMEYNYMYYPVIFDEERLLRRVVERLNEEAVFPRRYFTPALNTLPYLAEYQPCPAAESIASRVLCLPLYPDLEATDAERIMRILASSL